jgi:hypothetical protein
MGTKQPKQKKSKNRFVVFMKYAIIGTIIAFILVFGSLGFAKFPIDYTNGKTENATIAENNAQTMIQAQTVPTVVNGIIASTSIIIGFSATLIGIFLRDEFSNDRKAKQIMVGFLVMYILSIAFLLEAYTSLTTVWSFSLENALKFSLMGLNTSVFLLLFVYLFYLVLNERTAIDFDICYEY